MTVSISLSTCMTHSYMKHKYLGLMKRGLNDQHDTAKLLDAFFNDFRGQYPNLAETVKIIGGMEPSSSKLEREFSQITIVLNRRRNRLTSKSLLELLQGRNFCDLVKMVDSEK